MSIFHALNTMIIVNTGWLYSDTPVISFQWLSIFKNVLAIFVHNEQVYRVKTKH